MTKFVVRNPRLQKPFNGAEPIWQGRLQCSWFLVPDDIIDWWIYAIIGLCLFAWGWYYFFWGSSFGWFSCFGSIVVGFFLWTVLTPLRCRFSYKMTRCWLTENHAIIEVRMGWIWRVYVLPRKEIKKIGVNRHYGYYTVYLGKMRLWWRTFMRGPTYFSNCNSNRMLFHFYCLSRADCDAFLAHFPPGIINVWSYQENQYMQWSRFCALGYDSNWANET